MHIYVDKLLVWRGKVQNVKFKLISSHVYFLGYLFLSIELMYLKYREV
jgi:hypothetical protein